MPGLPATGTLSYNGITFDGASHIEVTVEPIYDEAEVTVIAQRYTITARAILAESTSLDGNLLNIRKRLLQSGGPLVFVNKGFGDDLFISGRGTGRQFAADINRGPKPRILTWKPIGDDKAAEIVWVVQTDVARCLVGVPRTQGVSALNFSMAFSIDAHGDTTRTMSGYIQITKPGSSIDTADAYRNKFAADTLKGFKREQDWQVSADRTRVDFTIVDTQIPSPNPYPENITEITASHRLSLRYGRGGQQRINVISMKASARSGLSPAQGWLVFVNLVRQRLDIAKQKGMNPFLMGLELEENIYGRSQSFSAQYRFLQPVTDFLGETGLWKPIGNKWDTWTNSLKQNAHHPYGTARLRDVGANATVISLCEPVDSVIPNTLQSIERQQQPPRIPDLSNESPSAGDEKANVMAMEHAMEPRMTSSVVRHAILQAHKALPGQVWNAFTNIIPSGFSLGESEPSSGNQRKDDVIQEGTAQSFDVSWKGWMILAGKAARPLLVKYGGQTATEVASRYRLQQLGIFFGVPLYKQAWDLAYTLAGPPGAVDVPDNVADAK